MNFFEAQDRARRRSKRLVLLFALAVLGTILAGYAAALFVLRSAGDFERSSRPNSSRTTLLAFSSANNLWQPRLFGWIAGGTIAVVGLASLFKWSQMRQGGAAIAAMVGGRPVEPRTTDLAERRLLNVIEEMAIASGTPMPAVFILDDEPAINAFAAGLTTADAAIAVTRGTLDKLTRDELQGVIAHEFSHILNGDMRLNVRLTAVVFGILVIGLVGRGLLRTLGRGRVRLGGDGKGKGGGIALVVAIGLALLIVGYIGYFFGRLIQAAVSRQREFLADASAVQFTRNPGGIGGALRKIGGYSLGGRLVNHEAGEFSHFFIAQAFGSAFGGLWATHPPLEERIRAVEPNWDGKLFEPDEVVDITRESFQTAGFGGGQRFSADETVRRAHAAPADITPAPPPRRLPFKPAAVVADIGALTESHLRHAQTLLATLPERLREAARDPASAPLLVFSLVLQTGPERARQTELLDRTLGPDGLARLTPLRQAISVIDPAVRLPLLQLCEPALRTLDSSALDQFVSTLDELVHVDDQVTLGEFALQRMLVHHLRLGRSHRTAQAVSAFSVDLALVLSCLAHAGARDETAAAAAFAAGARQLGRSTPPELLPPGRCRLDSVDAALDRLALAPLAQRQQLLSAAAHVIGADGTVSLEEGDLYRAIAASLDCPTPVFAPASAA